MGRTLSRTDRWESAVSRRIGRPAAFVLLGELRLLATVTQLAAGRRDVRDDEDAIGYARGRLAVELVFAGLAVLELVAVDILVPWDRLGSWSGLRWVLMIASAYGVLWIALWMAGERTRPYLATADGLVLRWGHLPVAEIPWHAVESVRVHRRYTADPERLTLDVPLQGTNLDIQLEHPVSAGVPFRRRRREVTAISLGVDEPEEAAALIASRIRRPPQS
jgi:hypothetical protein